MNQQDTLNSKLEKAKEEIKTHSSQLMSYLKSLQAQYLAAATQQPQQKLPSTDDFRHYVNTLVNAYEGAVQKLVTASTNPVQFGQIQELLDMSLEKTRKNVETIELMLKKYQELERRQNQITERILSLNNQQQPVKNILDYLAERDCVNFVKELIDWENALMVIEEGKSDDAIILLSDALLACENDLVFIEDVGEGIMAFLGAVDLQQQTMTKLETAIGVTLNTKECSTEQTPAIIDAYNFLRSMGFLS
ncbi:Uncharacterized protein QTN25_003092 [Entamoeba marina]